MEDKKANANAETVGVTLFPSDYDTVEMVTDQGVEILQQLSFASFLLGVYLGDFTTMR